MAQQTVATFPVTCPFCGRELDGLHCGNILIVPEHYISEEDGVDEVLCEGSGQEAD